MKSQAILDKLLPRRLHLQLMLLTALAFLITLIFFAVYSASEQSRVALNSIQSQALSLARNVATTSSNMLIVGSHDRIEELLLQSAAFPDVQEIQLTDAQGNILSRVVKKPGSLAQPSFSKSHLDLPTETIAEVLIEPPGQAGKMVVWHPIVGSVLLGWVRIDYDIAAQNAARKKIWVKSLIASVLAIIIIAALLNIFLRHPMRALHDAKEFAARLDHTRGEQLPHFHGAAEIEDLRNALNHASSQLYRQEQAIARGIENLHSNEIRLKEALDSLENQKYAMDQHAIVSTSDIEGNIIYANDQFCEISQYKREELIGQNHRIVNSGHHPQAYFEEMWRTISAGKVWRGETRNRAKGGSYYWVSATVVPFMDDEAHPYQYIAICTDITARKQMEEQIKSSNRFLHSLTDALGVGIYALDAQGRCTFLNREAEKLLGWSKEELMGKSIHDLIHFQTADGIPVEKADCPTHKAIQHGETFRSDADFFTRKDGSIFCISIVAVPLQDDEQVVGSVAGFQDITERKRTEQALIESEKKHRSVVESLNEVVFQTDWQGLWTYLNPVWTEITGYSVEESLATNMLLYIHADDRQRNFEQFMPLIERKKEFCRYEVRFLTKDRGYRWLEIFATLSLDEENNIVGTTGVLNDVTERKIAEDRLRDQLQFTQQLIEVTPYPIYFQDVSGHYLGFNKAFEIFWGIKRDEWIGKTVYDLLPKELADLHHEKDLLLLQRQDIQSYEAPVQAADRNIHATIYQKAAFTRADGGVAGLIGIISDITEAKQSATELKRAKESAESANQAKSDFLANMSHEIRTPMNGIIGMTELALDTKLTPLQREYLGMVKYSADSLLTIINDILDFSKIEAGKMSIESIPFSLHNMLNETIKPMALRAGQKGLGLSLELAPQVPDMVVGDPGRLRQILINLIGNAIKFTEQGQILISAIPEFVFDRVTSLHFSVSDSGAGISKDKQAGIFDAFSQADSSITRKYGGTGLGLSITSRLVEMMKGKIWLESEEGIGSTFHFTAQFGICAEPIQKIQDENPPDSTWPGEHTTALALNILLAEDNAINQRLAVALLEKAGHRVQVAQNGHEALALSEHAHFDLVLMDMQMPEMDGIEATQCIRARERQTGGHLPIIALTANAMAGDRDLCLNAGMDGYVPKPIQPAVLFSTIAATLKREAGAPPLHAEEESIQAEIFDYAAAVAKTDPDILSIIGAMVLAEIPQYMTKIESSLKREDWAELERVAHTFKGLLGNFGAKPAVECALSIEESARHGNQDEAAAHYRKLQEEIGKFEPAMAATLSN